MGRESWHATKKLFNLPFLTLKVRNNLSGAASNVRRHLDYAAPVWDPHLQKDIDELERKNWLAGYDDFYM